MVNTKWKEVSVKDLMKIETGSRNTEDKIDNGQYPFFVRSQTVEHIGSFHYDCEAVLTAGDGVGTGKVFHYINGKFDAHQRVYVMSQFKDVLGKYFYYWFSKNFFAEVAKYTAKSSVDSVRKQMIAGMVLPLPSAEEQQKIVGILSDIDTLITNLQKLIQKKKDIRRGSLQFYLNDKNRYEWVECPITELLKSGGIKIGPFGSQLKKEMLLSDGLYKVYGQENVYERDFSIGGRFLTPEHFQRLNSCEIIPGDFLMSTMGTIGKCAIVPEHIQRGIMDSHLIRLRFDEKKIEQRYILHLFSDQFDYLKRQTQQLSVGGIMEGLSVAIVSKLIVRYPKKAKDQKEIIEIFDDMNLEIRKLEEKLSKYQKIKQGMMEELLTGKVRLM